MEPDSTTMYIEDENRLVDVAVKEAIVRPNLQRRVTIAPVTDTLRVNPKTHADIMREVDTESYNPLFGSANTAEAAKAEPNKTHQRACQAYLSADEPTQPVVNMICEVNHVNTIDHVSDWLPTGNTMALQSHMKTA